ncbi:hypothetical protein [Petroclostridium sp. X23]|uniref:hypothetical protein n=1 Tax=Petroclostridium sp. X23 TaxID=3045146 RepID=UPI0024ADEAF7|nr:hypothetical protein [Petroclostridium sp. X23]WHH58481.1 hypothetical protein QKW49_22210 [Petroclostridium sp. X23]
MYADVNYYKDVYKGTLIPDGLIEQKLEKAADQIDSMTYNRIAVAGFDNLTPFQQEKIKKAVCAQADYTYQYGDYLNMPLSGFSAGSTSMSFKGVEAVGVKTSDEVINYLKVTGLTWRGL